MFTNQHHLRHLLRPEHYVSPEQHRTEIAHLFRPSWHPVCTVHDLARSGDFFTTTFFDTPILLRNFDGELRAFLNVCPHRHSQLTDLPRGRTERLRCQYHGWEFTEDGHTGKIPDAKAFRPWDRENSCLTRFALETCGEVVFIRMSDTGPTLREWFGPLWDYWAGSLGGDFRYAESWEQEFPCNWKVVLENSLESYHIPEVHPKTFKDYPPETNAWHQLDPRFSTFKTMIPDDWVTRQQNLIVRLLGRPVTGEYWHHLIHPHVTFSALDVHRLVTWVLPTSPTTCRYRAIMYSLRGTRRGPVAWAFYRFLRSMVLYVGKKVFAEDGSIYTGVQKGLEASPHRGVIGTREERIHTFQQFVLNQCRPTDTRVELDTVTQFG